MKNKRSGLILFAFLVQMIGLASVSRAWVFEEVPDKTATIKFRFPVAANISSAAVVIDLTDTTNFPHTKTGEVNISSVRIDVDKTATSTETIKLGVVTAVNESTGTVSWFLTQESTANVSNTNVQDFVSYTPNFLRLRVNPGPSPAVQGLTPYLLTNDMTTASTIYQTDVVLVSPLNQGSAPGVGDIVMSAVTGTSSITINLEVQYHTNSR